MVTRKTGLILDPYLSGTKPKWILDQVPWVCSRAERGELLFGTIDSFLIWRLTGGKAHVTDTANAARTLLFNIRDNVWDDEILNTLNIPKSMLPRVSDCAADYGTTRPDLFRRAIPILGGAGDQQAATIGQACFAPGMMKSTYGTGRFTHLNTGSILVESRSQLLGTIACRLGGQTTMRWKGRSSLRALWSSGCATG